MAYNSNEFSVSATTTSQTINLPSLTSAIVLRSPVTNTDTVSVRLGGGSPIVLAAGDTVSISIEQQLVALTILEADLPPQIFINTAAVVSNSGTQTLRISVQEWRLR
jgi:hypothetical protein